MIGVVAVLILLVGLPGSGKTTTARRLAAERAALRLSPDEWMLPLFGAPDLDGKRDVLEGRLISVALRLLELGTSVVLDFGCWSRNERCALRWLADRAGGTFELVYLPVDRATQQQRVAQRRDESPLESIVLTTAELDSYEQVFDVPDAAELAGSYSSAPPQGWADWLAWAIQRWPALTAT